MKLFLGLVFLFFLALGWAGLSDSAQQTLFSLFHAAQSGDASELKIQAKEQLLSQNPEEKRGALIEDLKRNLGSIKEQTVSKNPGSKSAESFASIISESEKILDELDSLNKAQPIESRAFKKLLDAIIPGPAATTTPLQCVPSDNS